MCLGGVSVKSKQHITKRSIVFERTNRGFMCENGHFLHRLFPAAERSGAEDGERDLFIFPTRRQTRRAGIAFADSGVGDGAASGTAYKTSSLHRMGGKGDNRFE